MRAEELPFLAIDARTAKENIATMDFAIAAILLAIYTAQTECVCSSSNKTLNFPPFSALEQLDFISIDDYHITLVVDSKSLKVLDLRYLRKVL